MSHPHAIPLTDHSLLALSRSALAALRDALLHDAGPGAAAYLQDAGYAGGETVFASFRAWLEQRGIGAAEELDMADFQRHASEYFREAGWGTLDIGTLNGAVITVDSENWAESDPSAQLDRPSCHFTTGMFADFFGRLSDVPLSVLEVECRSAGASRCRFLLGATDVMRYVYEEMKRGERYEAAAGRVE